MEHFSVQERRQTSSLEKREFENKTLCFVPKERLALADRHLSRKNSSLFTFPIFIHHFMRLICRSIICSEYEYQIKCSSIVTSTWYNKLGEIIQLSAVSNYFSTAESDSQSAINQNIFASLKHKCGAIAGRIETG